MKQKRLDRINELARKQKTVGLTDAEKAPGGVSGRFPQNPAGPAGIHLFRGGGRKHHTPQLSEEKRYMIIPLYFQCAMPVTLVNIRWINAQDSRDSPEAGSQRKKGI